MLLTLTRYLGSSSISWISKCRIPFFFFFCFSVLFQSSWPKVVARKWLNIQSGADEFDSDYAVKGKILKFISYISGFNYAIISFTISDNYREILFLISLSNSTGKTCERRKSCSDDDYYVFVREDFSGIFIYLPNRNDTVLLLLFIIR